MKIINPQNTSHFFYFQPRFIDESSVTFYLKNEVTGIEEEVNNTITLSNGVVIINFDFNCEEKDFYKVKLTQNNKVIYRDKIICLSNKNTNLTDSKYTFYDV